MIKLRYFLPLLPLVLSSCASIPEQPRYPSAQCFPELSSKPELQILKGKVSLPEMDYAMGRDRPSLEMMASTAMPNDAEKSAISAWSTAANECWNSGADWRTKYMAGWINSEIDKHVTNVQALVTDLSAGKINYGEYARTWTVEASAYRKDIVAIVRTMNANRNDMWVLTSQASQPMGGYPIGNPMH